MAQSPNDDLKTQAQPQAPQNRPGERGGMERGLGGQGGRGGEERFGGGSVATNLTATALRGFSQLFDLQATAARIMFRSQLRAAAAIGLPDFSRIFNVTDDRATRLFSTTTETALRFTEQSESTRGEIQSHLLRLLEQQMADFMERWQYGLDELQRQSAQSLEDLKELSRQQAEEMARATESLTDATRATLREGGEQFRATVRQGMERTREIAQRQTRAVNEEAEGAGEAMRGAMNKAVEAAERSGRPARSA